MSNLKTPKTKNNQAGLFARNIIQSTSAQFNDALMKDYQLLIGSLMLIFFKKKKMKLQNNKIILYIFFINFLYFFCRKSCYLFT